MSYPFSRIERGTRGELRKAMKINQIIKDGIASKGTFSLRPL
jgi:hypothetical protein